MPDPALLWFVLLGTLLAGYAVLDGFDLGVGILHPLARTERERRTFVAAIGPLWDGNEVWLVTFGGALFAFFPEAYATLLSGFYPLVMLLLVALILRAVSLEFRGKIASAAWRRLWDAAFAGSSLVATFLYGLAAGNVVLGLPLDERGAVAGGALDLLRPYPVLIAALAVALFAMHGALFLYLKTEGAVQQRLGRWIWHAWGVFLVLYVLSMMATLIRVPRASEHLAGRGWVAAVVVAGVLAVANVPRALTSRRYGQAFLSSSVIILALVFQLGVALFPDLVPALDPDRSLTIERAASSETTLVIGLIIVAVGMPFVLAYTAIVYWTFRGKVDAGDGY